MAQKVGVFYPARVNMFVPNMKSARNVLFNQPNTLDFGATAAAATVYGPTAALTTGVAATFLNLGIAVADKWGRGMTIVGSAASTRTFILRGRDYLGQPCYFSGVLNGA